MPFCGFDKRMLDGLDMFYEGLIRAVENKSKKRRVSLDKILEEEMNEMHMFSQELNNLNNKISRQSLMGVTYLAQALYKGAADYSKQKNIPLSEALKEQKAHLRSLFYKTDEYYETRCRGKPNPMKYLVDEINKFEL